MAEGMNGSGYTPPQPGTPSPVSKRLIAHHCEQMLHGGSREMTEAEALIFTKAFFSGFATCYKFISDMAQGNMPEDLVIAINQSLQNEIRGWVEAEITAAKTSQAGPKLWTPGDPI